MAGLRNSDCSPSRWRTCWPKDVRHQSGVVAKPRAASPAGKSRSGRMAVGVLVTGWGWRVRCGSPSLAVARFMRRTRRIRLRAIHRAKVELQ